MPLPRYSPYRFGYAPCAVITAVMACVATCADAGEHQFTPAQQQQAERHTLGVASKSGRNSVMRAAPEPMPLKSAATPTVFTWRSGAHTLTLDDYFERQPVLALLIAKDGEIVYERYQNGRTAQHHYLSNSMAKSITSLALGFARAEGKIPSFDMPLQRYLPELNGSAYGETTLRNLMRMGSGVKFSETYKPDDDSTKFRIGVFRVGIVAASQMFNQREVPQGSRFNYASIETALMSPALKAATKEGLASYLESRLWQAIGAEGPAYWQLDRTGHEIASGALTALPRDYLRLGMVLANDGKRPDSGRQVIPADYLLETTDWHQAEIAFQPRRAAPGYSNYFWLQAGAVRRFALLGVHGQAIYVDAPNKLVVVHLAASEAPRVGEVSMGRERTALWQGVTEYYGQR